MVVLTRAAPMGVSVAPAACQELAARAGYREAPALAQTVARWVPTGSARLAVALRPAVPWAAAVHLAAHLAAH